MYSLFILILKNLGRNKLRTVLTATGIVLLSVIYAHINAVTSLVNQLVDSHSSQTRLMVREKWIVPSRFPTRYVPDIASHPGVEDWTVWHLYAGGFDEAGHGGMGFGTRIDNLKQMHPGLEDLDQALVDAVAQERTGALVGRQLIDQMNWKIGQKFTMLSITHPGKNLEFTILGILESDVWRRVFFFREDYFKEAADEKDTVSIMWVRVANKAVGRRVAAELERRFENSPAQLKVETESAGVSRFAGRTNTIVNILNLVVTILLINMVVVFSNSISITVRERRKEMAILKVLGFQRSFILVMIVGEAVVIGAISGAFGAILAYVFGLLNTSNMLPVKIDFLLFFPISLVTIFHSFIIGSLAGFVGSMIPAWQAQKVQVAEVFSKVE